MAERAHKASLCSAGVHNTLEVTNPVCLLLSGSAAEATGSRFPFNETCLREVEGVSVSVSGLPLPASWYSARDMPPASWYSAVAGESNAPARGTVLFFCFGVLTSALLPAAALERLLGHRRRCHEGELFSFLLASLASLASRLLASLACFANLLVADLASFLVVVGGAGCLCLMIQTAAGVQQHLLSFSAMLPVRACACVCVRVRACATPSTTVQACTKG